MRVIRLLVYEGDEEWVLKTVASSIQGTKEILQKSVPRRITAITLGTVPDGLDLLIRQNEPAIAEDAKNLADRT